MTIRNAIDFIRRGVHDDNLRKRLNRASDISEADTILKNEALSFSSNEFEEAFTHLLTQCSQEEEAEVLKEFGLWWKFLSQTLSPDQSQCGAQCSSCPSMA